MEKLSEREITKIYKELEPEIGFLTGLYGYDGIDKIVTEYAHESTDKLIQLISEEELSRLISIYRIFSRRGVSKESTFNFPKREIKQIDNILESLETKLWLTDYSLKKIQLFIKEHIAYSPNGTYRIGLYLLKRNIKTGGRSLDDPALIILIVLLISLLIAKSGRPHYRLVADFLSEQGIVAGITDDAIKKSDKGITDDAIKKSDKGITDDAIKKSYKRNIKSVRDIIIRLKRIGKISSLMEDLSSKSSPEISSLAEAMGITPKFADTPVTHLDKIMEILDKD